MEKDVEREKLDYPNRHLAIVKILSQIMVFVISFVVTLKMIIYINSLSERADEMFFPHEEIEDYSLCNKYDGVSVRDGQHLVMYGVLAAFPYLLTSMGAVMLTVVIYRLLHHRLFIDTHRDQGLNSQGPKAPIDLENIPSEAQKNSQVKIRRKSFLTNASMLPSPVLRIDANALYNPVLNAHSMNNPTLNNPMSTTAPLPNAPTVLNSNTQDLARSMVLTTNRQFTAKCTVDSLHRFRLQLTTKHPQSIRVFINGSPSSVPGKCRLSEICLYLLSPQELAKGFLQRAGEEGDDWGWRSGDSEVPSDGCLRYRRYMDPVPEDVGRLVAIFLVLNHLRSTLDSIA